MGRKPPISSLAADSTCCCSALRPRAWRPQLKRDPLGSAYVTVGHRAGYDTQESMNSMHRRAARSACALILGCASESIPGPPQGLPYSAAFRACGPADGPAVTIILGSGPIEPSNPSTPHVRITISRPLDQLPGHSLTVDNETGAWYVSASHQFESGGDRKSVV